MNYFKKKKLNNKIMKKLIINYRHCLKEFDGKKDKLLAQEVLVELFRL